jgi:sugar lactone lactonase YvrE
MDTHDKSGPLRRNWKARLLGSLLLCTGCLFGCGGSGGSIQLFVTDTGNNRIVEMKDMTGTGWRTFGTSGSGTNQFAAPTGMMVTPNYYILPDSTVRYPPFQIFVSDTGNNRIVRMDDMTGTNWTTFGSAGNGVDQLSGPEGVFVDLADNNAIYIADTGNNRIVRMDDMTGTNWSTFGTGGSGANQFIAPSGIVVTPAGTYSTANYTVVTPLHIYVTDSGNNRIVRMDDMTGTNWTAFGTGGGGVDQFQVPAGIVVNPANLYVADSGNNRIMQMVIMDPDNGNPILTGLNWVTFGTMGNGTSQFNAPLGVVLGGGGVIYIADTGNDRIVRMDDMTGTNWSAYGTGGNGVGQFNNPASIVYRFQD